MQDASLLIRKLDPALKRKLRVRAASHGRSMEAEAREILRAALAKERVPLVDSIRRRFAAVGYLELKVPPRAPIREPPAFK